MIRTIIRTAALGGVAGTAGSIVQAAVGKATDIAFLPPRENSHVAPRLMSRLAATRGVSLSSAQLWTLGTLFHVGYGAGWGKLYAMVRERRPVHPLVGGTLLGGLIYAITFPRWGGAVQTGTERVPERRSSELILFTASVTLSFGLSTAYVYEALRGEDD